MINIHPEIILGEYSMSVDSSTLDLITGGLAIAILVGGMMMMFTTIFSTKR
ncbi:hypothetical protein [Sphaerospermopsis aphanizomenoides]|uniref:hypothetical protein n=1 Tax=Sphaerospermopsis aphanizomenoides TaxID=459663 RepID=UPI00190689A5|nr:hypothetical protein [Sphaerospermopsis aphanizomenoides]